MSRAEPPQLALAVSDLAVELVDQAQAGLDRSLPRLRQAEPGEQLAAAHAEEVGDGAGLAMREQHRVHALLEAGAVADEMQPPTCTLALGAHERIRQPDRRHQITACELGQHPSVDAIGLARQRRQPLHLLCVRDLDPPASELEPVVHEARTVHRLDRRPHRRAVRSDALAQVLQSISIRRRGTDVERRTLAIEQVEVETLATEIQPGVQHCNGPPFVYRGRAEHHSAGGPSSWHSLPSPIGNLPQPVATNLACVGGFGGRWICQG
jgi:hypothetical protein